MTLWHRVVSFFQISDLTIKKTAQNLTEITSKREVASNDKLWFEGLGGGSNSLTKALLVENLDFEAFSGSAQLFG